MWTTCFRLSIATFLLLGTLMPQFSSAQPPRTRPGPDRPSENREEQPDGDWPRARRPGERQEAGQRSVTNAAAPEVRVAPRIAPPRGDWFLGVYTDRAPRGLRLSQIVRGSPASRFGLEVGDYILDVSGYVVGEYNGRFYPLPMALNYGVDRDGWAELLVWNKRTFAEETLWVRLQRR